MLRRSGKLPRLIKINHEKISTIQQIPSAHSPLCAGEVAEITQGKIAGGHGSSRNYHFFLSLHPTCNLLHSSTRHIGKSNRHHSDPGYLLRSYFTKRHPEIAHEESPIILEVLFFSHAGRTVENVTPPKSKITGGNGSFGNYTGDQLLFGNPKR